MLLDRYFDSFFHNTPRIPSRVVRYGIIHADTIKSAVDDFEPKLDPAIKHTAEKIVAALIQKNTKK